MAKVRNRDTKPELIVRSKLHRAGLRFRLQAKELPGRPDIVFRKAKVAVFVHGCFWHRHKGCAKTRMPKSNWEFWAKKFERNMERDRDVLLSLKDMGWSVYVVWECETERDLSARIDEISRIVKSTGS